MDSTGSDTVIPSEQAVREAITAIPSPLWIAVPGSPTRSDDDTFTITDASNANLYNKKFVKGVVLTWLESTTRQFAMVTSAAYDSNTVTVEMVGNSLTAGFSDMKFFIIPAKRYTYRLPFTMPGNTATTNIGDTWYPECDVLIFSADARCETAASGSATVFDLNDDASTIFDTKPTIADGQTSDLNNVCNCLLANAVTVVAGGSKVTVDYDSGNATTPCQDVRIDLFYMPEWWRYLI